MASGKKNVHLEDNLKSGPIETCNDVSKILDDFHYLYNEKLRNLEIKCGASSEVKLNVLEEWVRDLTEQNRMLIKTVEHLEKNAIDRVDILDNVLRQKNTVEQKHLQPCNVCPDVELRLEQMQGKLNCANESIKEKDILLCESMRQAEDLQNALYSQTVSVQAAKNSKGNYAELESTIMELRNQLCRNEKILNTRTKEVECLKYTLMDKEKEMEMLKLDKTRSIPQMQEAIGLLKDAIKEKDVFLEQYHQEITFLKEENERAEEQNCKMLQLQDTVKYCQQSLKQKDLMLEKLKEHIKQLRQALSQLQCQDQGRTSRSSSIEGNYALGEMSDCVSFSANETVMAGGDSELVENLKKKLANEKDMQIALTTEVAEKHDAIMRLKEHVKELEEQLRQSDMQTHFKDDIIRQLRKEVKLGRAKESLAEMLGLKGGPRAQMKAKIDHLHSELEEREVEISRLEGKLEASRLPTVEAKLTRMEVELVDRERSVITLCDKLDFVRRYLSKLRGSDEDISVKCGLEALLIELSEDMEWTRETRRNISIPSTDDPKESIIIINHRSRSLPDTTLKQVQSLNASSENPVHCANETQNLQEMSECLNLKEQISNLESNLTESLSQLSNVWECIKTYELECGDSLTKTTLEIQDAIEKEHSQLLQVNKEVHYIGEQIVLINTLGTKNDYLLDCIEKCLVDSLDILVKQKTLIGISPSSSDSLLTGDDSSVTAKYIASVESNLCDSVSLLQKLKSKLTSWAADREIVDVNKTKEMNNVVNNIISNKQTVLDKLCLVYVSQEDISKKMFKKFADFDKLFGNHQSIVKGLKFVLNKFIFNDFLSKNWKKDLISLRKCDGIGQEGNVPIKKIKVVSTTESNKIKSLRKNRLSRSSPSIGEEYQSDALADIHMKSAHLQQIVLSLNEEVKTYLKEVLLREDKVRRFICECQELNKTLDTLNKELCASEKIFNENESSKPKQSLQFIVGQAQAEAEILLCKIDDFTTYKDMYEVNRSKMEQDIQTLQKDMFVIVSDIMDVIKVSQEYDNNLLNSYRNKIQNYREKVEQLEKHLTNSIDENEMEEKQKQEEEEEDIIHKLTEKLEKYQLEVEKLRNSICSVKKDKEAVELGNQKVMEELQAKICSLQAALQSEVQKCHPVSNKPWFLSWPNGKQMHSRHVHDV